MEKDTLEEIEIKYKEQNQLVIAQTQKVTKINIEYEKIQQILPELRGQESKITADLQKNSLKLENQEIEIQRANKAADEICIRIEQIKDDLNREQFLLDDAIENLSRVLPISTSNLKVNCFGIVYGSTKNASKFFSILKLYI